MKVYREQAKQVHPIPSRVYGPTYGMPSQYDNDAPGWASGRSSSPHLFEHEVWYESEIVDNYLPAMPEDGSDQPVGATAQNNFQAIKWLYCGTCYEKVKANETANHICEVSNGAE